MNRNKDTTAPAGGATAEGLRLYETAFEQLEHPIAVALHRVKVAAYLANLLYDRVSQSTANDNAGARTDVQANATLIESVVTMALEVEGAVKALDDIYTCQHNRCIRAERSL